MLADIVGLHGVWHQGLHAGQAYKGTLRTDSAAEALLLEKK